MLSQNLPGVLGNMTDEENAVVEEKYEGRKSSRRKEECDKVKEKT